MRTTGLIAGGLGITVVFGVLLVLGGVGVVVLGLVAPARRGTAADLRAAIVDHQDDLAFCGAGHAPGHLIATVVVADGRAAHVAVTDAELPAATAHCVADTLVSASWPRVSAAVTVPLHFE
jgi:hypothetical protein